MSIYVKRLIIIIAFLTYSATLSGQNSNPQTLNQKETSVSVKQIQITEILNLVDLDKSNSLSFEEAVNYYIMFSNSFASTSESKNIEPFDINQDRLVDLYDQRSIGTIIERVLNPEDIDVWRGIYIIPVSSDSKLTAEAAINNYHTLHGIIGTKSGEEKYIPHYDINENGVIDQSDADELLEISSIYLKSIEKNKWASFLLMDQNKDTKVSAGEKQNAINLLRSSMNSSQGDQRYSISIDVNEDGFIDHLDLSIISWAYFNL